MSDTAIPVLDKPVVRRTLGRRKYTKRVKATAPKQPRAEVREDEVRAEPIRQDQPDDNLTRKSRGERSVGRFNVPTNRRRAGWDYQWVTISVLNLPVDGSTIAEAYEGGWRPVPAAEMPELLTPGTTASTVDNYGQRLFMRPLRLTQEAKAEDYAAAKQQERDRIQGVLEGRPRGVEGLADIRGIRPHTPKLDLEGEMGGYASERPRGSS